MAIINRPFEFVLLEMGAKPASKEDSEALPVVVKINGDKSVMRAEAEKLARGNPGVRYAICAYNGVVEAELVAAWDD